MYSLIVWEALDELTGRTLSVSRQRFLEYTDSDLATSLMTLSGEALDALAKWPMLVMTEGQTDEEANVVFAESIRPVRDDIVVRFREGRVGPILNEQIWKLRRTLDIADWEFSRSHWAVKEVDLAQVLREAGFSIPAELEANTSSVRLAPSRMELLVLRDRVARLSHQQIDDILTVAGIDGLNAGRSVGSRADRANAIMQFALVNPGAITVERQLFTAFLDKRVAELSGTTADEGAAFIPSSRNPKRVFVVHGREQAVKDSVVDYLRELGLEPVILHEQPSMGRHLLTKFMEEAELATFAVILMTDDDVGGRPAGSLRSRARQNVILELGYFLSRLGQRNVCALVTRGLETPSDFDGIVYVPLDEADAWRGELKRELKAAGLPLADPRA